MILAIVGGGAAGLAAALTAAETAAFKRIVILEKEQLLARKLAASGNGRCNLGHDGVRLADYQTDEPQRLAAILAAYPEARMRAFWTDLALPPQADAEGRWYPPVEEAAAVRDYLQKLVLARGVELRLGCRVTALQLEARGYRLRFSETTENDARDASLFADRVIWCCGSAAYPQLGGSAEGLDLLLGLGLQGRAFRPALVAPLAKDKAFLRRADGQRVKARGRILQGQRCLAVVEGEYLFTDKAVSGIAAMELLQACGRSLELRPAGEGFSLPPGLVLSLDLLPKFSVEALRALLERRAALGVAGALEGLLRLKLLRAIFPKQPSADEAVRQLKDFRLELIGTRGLKEAQTCRFGLALSNLGPSPSLELKAYPGCFVAGEVLDVDGRTGGYNLYFAFASGQAAAREAARK